MNKSASKKDIKKVVLAYSGGLDTSIIIPVSYTHLDVYKRQVYYYSGKL